MRGGGAHQLAPHPALTPVVQQVERLHLAFPQAAGESRRRRGAAGGGEADDARAAAGGTSVPDAAATNTPVEEDRIAAS